MPGESLALLELIPCKATYTELANKLLNLLNEKLGSPFIITQRILVCLPYFYLEPAADKTEKALLILNKLRADYYLNCNCQVEGKFLIDSINIEAIFIIERTKDTINYLVKEDFITVFQELIETSLSTLRTSSLFSHKTAGALLPPRTSPATELVI